MRLVYALLVLLFIGCTTNITGGAYQELSQENTAFEGARGVIVKIKDVSKNNLAVNNEDSIHSLQLSYSKAKKIENVKQNILILESDQVYELMQELSQNPLVEYVEPDYPLELNSYPNDEFFGLLHGLHNNGTYGTLDSDIDALEAWNVTKGNSSVIIGVVDTGINYYHDDLKENIWVNIDEIPSNGIDDDNNGYVDDYYGYDFSLNISDPMDIHGHGTHCAGTIAARGNNSIGVIGVCPNCTIMAIKTFKLGSGFTSDSVRGIYYGVDNGADILSNSWGGPYYSQSLADAINYANQNGVLFVAAAGNSNNADLYYPAAYPGVLTVAAVQNTDVKSTYSNFAPWVDISAPGGQNSLDINSPCRYPAEISTFSTIAKNAEFATIWYSFGNSCGVVVTENQTYIGLAGTSMATPHVAGAAGLLKSKNPNWNPETLFNVLKYSSDDHYDKNPTFLGLLGTGRLNINNALRLEGNQPPVVQESYFDDSSTTYPNGFFDQGESVTAYFNLLNYWDTTYENINIVASTDNPYVTISDAIIDFGSLNPLENKTGSIIVSADEDIPFGELINIQLELTYNNLGVLVTNSTNFTLTVSRDFGWPKATSDDLIFTTSIVDDHIFLRSIIITTGFAMRVSKYSVDGIPIAATPVLNSPGGNDDVYANFDKDSNKETAFRSIAGSYDELNIYDDDLRPLPGWPKIYDNSEYEIISIVGLNIEPSVESELAFVLRGQPNKVTMLNASGDYLWNYTLPGSTHSKIAVGKLERDGSKKLLITTNNPESQLHVLNTDGTLNFSKTFSKNYTKDPLIADLDGDGNNEIIIASGLSARSLIVLDHLGNEVSGFPITINDGEVIASNLDGGRDVEIIHADKNELVSIIKSDGSQLFGWPQTINTTSVSTLTMKVIDYDNDQEQEILFVNGCILLIYELDGSYTTEVLSNQTPCVLSRFEFGTIGENTFLTYVYGHGATFLANITNLTFNSRADWPVDYGNLLRQNYYGSNCEAYDFDCDGIVNIDDLLELVVSFGSTNSEKDLNNDNYVNILDVVILVHRFS